jgi:hypothetical protein
MLSSNELTRLSSQFHIRRPDHFAPLGSSSCKPRWPLNKIVAPIHRTRSRVCVAMASARKVQNIACPMGHEHARSSSRFSSGLENRHGIMAFQENPASRQIAMRGDRTRRRNRTALDVCAAREIRTVVVGFLFAASQLAKGSPPPDKSEPFATFLSGSMQNHDDGRVQDVLRVCGLSAPRSGSCGHRNDVWRK